LTTGPEHKKNSVHGLAVGHPRPATTEAMCIWVLWYQRRILAPVEGAKS
jgi:hypothetical protein